MFSRAESVFGERMEEREGLLKQLRKMVEQEKGLVVPQVSNWSRNKTGWGSLIGSRPSWC